LEGCASFLLDWLIEGHGGYLETNPSTSPEHMFIAPDGKSASVSYSSTMDMALIKEVFSAIISASEVKLLFSMSVIITVLVFAKFSNF
jgi:alpha-L-fucosidase 2